MALAPTLTRLFDSGAASDAAEAEPPSATGQYPGPVWADEAIASPAGLALEDDPAVPPSATGQYPGPVWADEGSENTSAAEGLAAAGLAGAPPLGLKEDDAPGDAATSVAAARVPPVQLTNEGIYRII